MAINLLNNGESGIAVRNTLNELISAFNSSSFSGSVNITGSLTVTEAAVVGVFVHPQVITSNITIPAAHNGLLLTPISISGSITVGESSNLTIM